MEYVSIGNSCSVTYQKQLFGVKKETYPFDWIRSDTIDNISDAINCDFEGFIDNLDKITESDKFPVSNDDNFPDKNGKTKSVIMKNKYGMKFYHDFHQETNISDVKLKYERRIMRLIELIKSEKNICFVRDELKPGKITLIQINTFIETIKKINNMCKFNITVILHKPKKNHELINMNNDIIKIIVDNADFGEWFRPNVDWKKVFNIM